MSKPRENELYPVPNTKGKYVTDGKGNVYIRGSLRKVIANKDGEFELIVGYAKKAFTKEEVFPFVELSVVKEAGDTEKVDLVEQLKAVTIERDENIAISKKLIQKNSDYLAAVNSAISFANQIHGVLGSAPEVTEEQVKEIKALLLEDIEKDKALAEALEVQKAEQAEVDAKAKEAAQEADLKAKEEAAAKLAEEAKVTEAKALEADKKAKAAAKAKADAKAGE